MNQLFEIKYSLQLDAICHPDQVFYTNAETATEALIEFDKWMNENVGKLPLMRKKPPRGYFKFEIDKCTRMGIFLDVLNLKEL